MYTNYHTHTKRCQHARGEDREYVEAAIRAGIGVLGFSDHCPWIFPDGYVSNIRMEPRQVDGYFSSLESLRKEYAQDIRILIGFESEYAEPLMEAQEKFLADYPLDYMILGQHFVGVEPNSTYTGNPTSDENLLRGYIEQVTQGLKTGKYLYLAHPDVIHYTGPDDIYERHMLPLLQYMKENDIPVEINMLGAVLGRHYPSERFLRLVKKAGNSVIIGIDAHDPDLLEDRQGFAHCQDLIQKYQLPLADKLL